MLNPARYCTDCGDRIDDPEIRAWHLAQEHPVRKAVFCLFCGLYCPGNKQRAHHYDEECKNYPGRVGSYT